MDKIDMIEYNTYSTVYSLLLLCSAAIVQSKITGPGVEVALVGSNLKLTCSTDSTVNVCWEYYLDRDSIPRTVSDGRSVNDQYGNTRRVTSSDDGVTLTLLRVQLRDSGVYQCRECSTIHFADIEVIVLGK